MRKHKIGAVPVGGNWNPVFKASKVRRPKADKVGRKNTTVVAYFPTGKGAPRMGRLRHYFHKDMALLLDAWTDVVSWTSEAPAVGVAGGAAAFWFTPDFHVRTRDSSYAIRLLREGTTPAEARAERHRLAKDAYAARGESLVIISAEDLSTHPDLPAAKLLFLNRVRDWPDDLPATLAADWGEACPTTLGALHDHLGGSPEAWLQLLSLASLGFVELVIVGVLDRNTAVAACRTQGYRP